MSPMRGAWVRRGSVESGWGKWMLGEPPLRLTFAQTLPRSESKPMMKPWPHGRIAPSDLERTRHAPTSQDAALPHYIWASRRSRSTKQAMVRNAACTTAAAETDRDGWGDLRDARPIRDSPNENYFPFGRTLGNHRFGRTLCNRRCSRGVAATRGRARSCCDVKRVAASAASQAIVW